MLNPTQGGALDGGLVGVHGVNFHYPTEAVFFIGMFSAGQVKTLVKQFPAIAKASRREAVALLGVGRFPSARFGLGVVGAVAKVAVEVFFAGQVSAPRGFAVGAVVQGSQGRVTGSGAQQGAVGSGAAEGDGGVHMDPARSGAGHCLPLGSPYPANFHHRNPMGVL